MTNMQDPSQDWGGRTEWQEPSGPAQSQYGTDPQGRHVSAQPPYGYQQPLPGPPPQYGQPPSWSGAPAQAIQNYMIPAILVTLFCFLPTGIAAIVFASQVSSKTAVGDYNGAMQSSRQARLWTIVSVAAAAVFWVLFLMIIAAAGSSNTGTSGA